MHSISISYALYSEMLMTLLPETCILAERYAAWMEQPLATQSYVFMVREVGMPRCALISSSMRGMRVASPISSTAENRCSDLLASVLI